MPIGDLLAQISGDKASGSPAPAARRPDPVTSKRKAVEDLNRSASSKTPRFTPTPNAKPARPPTNNDIPPRSTPNIPARPLSNGNRSSRPVATAKRPLPPPPPSESLKPKGQPKRGSYAEILARGQRAQAVMGQVGKIQHKKVEKGSIKKDAPVPREEVAKKPLVAAQGRRPVSGYSGTAKPALQRNGSMERAAASRNRAGAPAPKPGAAGKKSAAAEVEKKVKKAALATTGYTGTARPRPEAPSKKPNAPRGGALLNLAAPRARTSQQSRYEDDYDEELDDFIDYDDEEEGPPRYDYASDASSDMEAGIDDIDDEERQAERIARREDLEQERLEKTLKNAKEERKRKALEALRANRR
ncbi:hypothetical protein ESCO_001149 [Escovopsis weberi]|uniref:Uncharacterized protein n=1 Tax=Escovopsis weberi TaxID=150374 RepID=A0A0M8MVY5_ESCWE|nr:hypothetical protein ESCO_001149 [Escovopsis weberi]